MSKGGSPGGFADVGSNQIDLYLGDVSCLVQGTEWAKLDRAEFGQAAAYVFAHLNQVHPFREGNGGRAGGAVVRGYSVCAGSITSSSVFSG